VGNIATVEAAREASTTRAREPLWTPSPQRVAASRMTACPCWPKIVAGLVVGGELADGGYDMPLFVVLASDAQLDDDPTARPRSGIRSAASLRQVPDEVIAAPRIPMTATGTKPAAPINRLLPGVAPVKVVNRETAADSDLVDRSARVHPAAPFKNSNQR
jgi:hypothetical protein